MGDTFSCDSCGLTNVPIEQKVKLLLKETINTKDMDGSDRKATSTIGMAICGNCKTNGLIHNNVVVDPDSKPQRHFGWHPSDSLKNVFYWNKRVQQNVETRRKRRDDDDDR